ncbi:uncharacterized protein RAG0_05555 [Rhynchosporium agropyri]|uniref:GH18 domain-containing protein n=1 Tax=Rhynchosporium agropyri TaxID=914238 RepID=A0A1E1KDI0_9HELO|nr:uncharacterized protein RAG0_05555 [Rhynchosporium agropyri]
MLYNWRLVLSALSFSGLIGHGQFVSGFWIPFRHTAVARRDVDTAALDLSNLGIVKQQSTTITVPKSELRNLLLQIRLLELQLIDILLNDGIDTGSGSTSDIAAPTFLTGVISSTITTSVPLASLSSAISSVLSQMTPRSYSLTTTETCSTPSASPADPTEASLASGTGIASGTRTIRVTRTTTATTITITTAPGFEATTNVAAPSTAAAPISDLADTTNVADINTTTTLPVTLSTGLPESLLTRDTLSSPPELPASAPTFVETTTSEVTSETEIPTSAPTFVETTTSEVTSERAIPTSETSLTGGGFIEVTNTVSLAAPAPTSPSTGYTFNAASESNIAVYFGQTAITGTTSLEAQCADPNIDIVILAFVISQRIGGIYPAINFGAACGGQTPEMVAQAPGLLSCPELAGNVSSCQNNYGKKVMLSIGGATSQISFTGEDQARTFGDVLWDLFGPPGNADVGLRPFGNVEVDGFDIDKEDRLPSYFGILATTLRSHFTSNPAKNYYIASAPQCPYPDASTPLDVLLLSDFVWVQFYNNPPCEIGSSGFAASVDQWSSALEASTLATKPRLYIGAPAFPEAGQSAYAKIGNAEGMKSIATEVKDMNVPNLGGIMFWDGPMGQANIGGGMDIIGWAKEGLES